ncbi:MAG TPA: endo-1,4-beta-xylanase [Tepidisphaeraceae bacterium]|jgi:GH35 family endo-1,4-beta-xylanase
MKNYPNRRTFLTGAAAAATSLLGCAKNVSKTQKILANSASTQNTESFDHPLSPTMADRQPVLRATVVEADGSPLLFSRMHTLHARDLKNDPLPQAIVHAAGRARIAINPEEPIQLSARLNVPGFGEVYCYADNQGQGYTKPEQIDFVAEAAKTRLHRVRQQYEHLRHIGLSEDPQFNLHLSAAAQLIPTSNATNRTDAAYASLAHSLHAGERLAINAANMRISRLARPRNDFLFGILASNADRHGSVYQQQMREVFNFATTSWYTWKSENAPDNDRVDYARMDHSIDWCLRNQITPKGFGYLYMAHGAVPPWMRPTSPGHFNPGWGYDRIKQTYATVIHNTMARYDGRIHIAEIMNEAHDVSNIWRLSHDQILDMAHMAFTAARQGSKTIQRQMNHCCLWAEYGKHKNADGSRRWSPWQFVKACIDAKVDYEIIGLQLYYPEYDIFEIDRMLDRFLVFNKPLHISELAAPSQPGRDPNSLRPHSDNPGWHGPWSESTQADWLEAIYTLVYSKPAFQAIGWWDFADTQNHFWPFGGLLDKNLQPKQSFHRLKQLQQRWGVPRIETEK